MTTGTSQPAGMRRICKREARDLFRAARMAEQYLYPAAEQHYDEHGTWPADYLAARAETARAFRLYADAGIYSGISVPVQG